MKNLTAKTVLLILCAVCISSLHQTVHADGCTGSTFTIKYSPACNCWQVCGNFISDCEEIKSIDWDFGDGGTATGKNPCHSYTQPGTYTVTMNIRACCHGADPFFPCSNIMNCQITNSVTVTQAQIDNDGPEADFSADTVCLGQATTFTNQSQFANDFTWKFPDGSISNAANPTYEFDSCGVYEQTISLIASDNTCCNSPSFDTISKPVYVKCPPNTQSNANGDTSDYIYETDASIIEDTVCHQEPMPFDLAKTDSIVDWEWSFSDGGASSNLSPQHVFDDCGANAQPPNHADVAVTNTHGCTDTVTEYVEVFCPFEFTGQVTNQGCYQEGGIILDFQGSSAALEYSNDCGGTFQSDSNYWFPLSPAEYCVVVRDTYQVCRKSDTFTVDLIGGPDIYEIDSMNPSCTGGTNSGYVHIQDSGGVSPISYQWSNGATTQDIDNVPAGTYSVTVIDANDCRDNATVTLEPFDAWLDVYRGCPGSADKAIDLTVTGGVRPLSYDWSNNATTQDISNLTPGTYEVTITDQDGCTLTLDTTITDPAPLQYDFTLSQYGGGYNISCHDSSDGSIDLTVQGGTSPYSYNWSAGASSQDLNNIPAGNYTVTITDDNGCTLIADTVLTEPPPLPSSLSISHYNGYNISCNGGSDGFIDLTISSGGQNFTYSWSNGSSSQDLSNIPAGYYKVTVTAPTGCGTTLDTTLIEPPPLNISTDSISVYTGGNNISCYGEDDGIINISVTGGVPPYSYNWNGGGNIYTTQDVDSLIAGNYSLTLTDMNGCTITYDTVLTEPQPVTDSVILSQYPGGDNVSCYGASDGFIEVTNVSGGTPPYGYVFLTSSDTIVSFSPDTTGLMAGDYTVAVGDQNGCASVHDTTLTEPPPLSTDFALSSYPSGDNVSCKGASDGFIDLTVNGGSAGYDYNWSTGDSTQDLDSIPAGQYNVTVTDTNGCTITADTTLTEPPPLTISATVSQYAGGYNVSCNGGSDGSIDLTVNGGTTPYSYSWNGGTYVSEDLINIPKGTYSVVVTDANGCTITFDTTLTEPPPITYSWTTSSYTGGWQVSCHDGTDGSIDLTANGGVAPYTYSWNGGTYVSQDLTNVPAGTYNVTITDTNGCTLSADTTLTEPPPFNVSADLSSFQGDNNISCFGFSDGSIDIAVSGSTPPYSYSWSTGDTTQDIFNITEGSYSVTITDTNGCTTVFDTTLTQPDPLATDIATSSYEDGYEISCHGFEDGWIDLTVSNGTAPYTYQWNGGLATTEDLDSVGAGTYTVRIIDANGCTITDSVTLTEPPPIETTLQSDDVTCYQGKDGYLSVEPEGGTNPYEIQWNVGQTGNTANNLEAGNYSSTITDANNCRAEVQATIFQPDPVDVDVKSRYEIRFGDTVQLTTQAMTNGKNISSYSWMPKADLSCTDCPNPDAYPLKNTTYTVTMVDEDGCYDTAKTKVIVDDTKILYIPNAFTPDNDDINDEFQVRTTAVQDFTLKIFNRWGEKVFETNDHNRAWDGMYKGEPCRPGVFVYTTRITYIDGETKVRSGSVTLIR